VWDLLAETGLYRLRGHKGQITGLEFLRTSGDDGEDAMRDAAVGDGLLISAGKDTLLKLWDLSTQHCVETHIAHHGEGWALAVMPDQRGCITAGNDGEVKVWGLNVDDLSTRTGGDTTSLLYRGTLYRNIRDRTQSVKFHPDGDYFAIHGTDKNIEIWRIRSED